MTPVPSSPVALLDQLDELRAKATPGPWVASAAARHDVNVNAPLFAGSRISTRTATAAIPADAALIVAAVNAVGPLADAVRAVLELHDCDEEDLCGLCRVPYPCRTRGDLTAALSVTP